MSVGIAGVFSGEVFLCAGLTGWAAGKRNSSKSLDETLEAPFLVLLS